MVDESYFNCEDRRCHSNSLVGLSATKWQYVLAQGITLGKQSPHFLAPRSGNIPIGY